MRWGMTPPAWWPERFWPLGSVPIPSVGFWKILANGFRPNASGAVVSGKISATVSREGISGAAFEYGITATGARANVTARGEK